MSRRIPLFSAAVSLAVTVSCAPRLASLPSGPGNPAPEFATAYAGATSACRDVRTLAGVLTISGRAAGNRLPRARVDAGFAMPAKVRLELPAPGKPFFIFVADENRATLVLPRDGRVLRDASPADTLEALTGVALAPGDLRTIVAGCGFGVETPSGGREFSGGWMAIDGSGATTWLQQTDGKWRLAASTRGPIDVRYTDYTAERPATIRLRTAAGASGEATDLTIRLSQVDLNTALGSEVFQVEIPSDATPMTLQELRQAGPLGR